jgi:hypothetical protein
MRTTKTQFSQSIKEEMNKTAKSKKREKINKNKQNKK